MQFDLLILGDTPDAWAAAETAAQLGRRTAVLRPDIDGRAAAAGVAAVLSAFADGALEGMTFQADDPRGLWNEAVRRHEQRIVRIGRDLDVRTWRGPVRLTGSNTAEVFIDGTGLEIEAELLLVAVGTTARRPLGLSFDRQRLLLPEQLPLLESRPRHVVVLGGNRTARAYSELFVAAGSAVTEIDAPGESTPPRACPPRVADVLDLQRDASGVRLRLSDGDTIEADAILFAADRIGATASIGLSAVKLEPDETGRLWCDEDGRTWVRSIAAAGEVVGFPKSLRDDADAARRLVLQHFTGTTIGRLDHPDVRRVPIPFSMRSETQRHTFNTPSIRPLLRVYDGV